MFKTEKKYTQPEVLEFRKKLSRAILLAQGSCMVVLGFLLANCRSDRSYVFHLPWMPVSTTRSATETATATASGPATTTLTTRQQAIERLAALATSRAATAKVPESAPDNASDDAVATGPTTNATPVVAASGSAAPVKPAQQASSSPASRLSFLPQEEIEKIWSDSTFREQFIGSYGINAEIEPRTSTDDIKVLLAIRDLLPIDLDLAAAELEKVIDPDSSAMLEFTLGNIRFQQDKMDEALDYYRRAVTKYPSFRRAWHNIGMIYARAGKFDDSINAFTKMIQLGGGDAYSYGLLGYSYAAKQDFQAAEVAYRSALLLQPENTEWRLGLTRCVYREQKYEDARTLLDGLIRQYPEKTEFWLLQANTYINMKQPLKAAEDLEAVDRMGKATAESLYTLGEVYVGEDLPDLAADAYCRAIKKDAAGVEGAPATLPTMASSQPADAVDPQASKAISRALRASDMLASHGANAQAQLVATQTHKSFDAVLAGADRRKLLKLEARLSMAGGNSNEQTVQVLEEIVRLDPLDGEALMLLGQHYSRSQDPQKAMIYYERAGNIDASEYNAKLRLGQLLVDQKRFTDALTPLRRVQEIKPREDVARYLDQVERAARNEALNKTPKPKTP